MSTLCTSLVMLVQQMFADWSVAKQTLDLKRVELEHKTFNSLPNNVSSLFKLWCSK